MQSCVFVRARASSFIHSVLRRFRTDNDSVTLCDDVTVYWHCCRLDHAIAVPFDFLSHPFPLPLLRHHICFSCATAADCLNFCEMLARISSECFGRLFSIVFEAFLVSLHSWLARFFPTGIKTKCYFFSNVCSIISSIISGITEVSRWLWSKCSNLFKVLPVIQDCVIYSNDL